MSKKNYMWTDAEKKNIAEITYGRHYKEILELMNKKFNDRFDYGQIKNAVKRYGLKTGFTGKYEKGNVPFNKGTKGLMKANISSFKKGHIPGNKRPVGSERIDSDGYTLIKVSEPSTWKLKHRLIYEKYKGEIPKGYQVIFADKDMQNFDIENLILVSKSELLKLNREKLIFKDRESTKAGLNIVKITEKIKELEKGE